MSTIIALHRVKRDERECSRWPEVRLSPFRLMVTPPPTDLFAGEGVGGRSAFGWPGKKEEEGFFQCREFSGKQTIRRMAWVGGLRCCLFPCWTRRW